MRLYHFTSANPGLENVRLRHLKIATLTDINDPFELAICCDDPVRRRALRRTRQQWASRFGMLCFSRDWHNPVQWSHYGDKHRGICLGFDVPEAILTEVHYRDDPLQLDWSAIESGGSAGQDEMIRWSSTKYSHWKYEDEYRAFLSLDEKEANGLYFANFGESLELREVIVGARSDISRRDVQTALGSLKDVQVVKTRLAFGSYRVVTLQAASRWE